MTTQRGSTLKEIQARHPNWQSFTTQGRCVGCGNAPTKSTWALGHDSRAKQTAFAAAPGSITGPVQLCASSTGSATTASTGARATLPSGGTGGHASPCPRVAGPFTDIVMVDWSANKTPKTGPDSIWIAHLEQATTPQLTLTLHNPATRADALDALIAIATKVSQIPGRLLVGFDFCFGLPSHPRSGSFVSAMEVLWKNRSAFLTSLGATAAVMGAPYPGRAVWDLVRTVCHDYQVPRSGTNNAGAIAHAINVALSMGRWPGQVFYDPRTGPRLHPSLPSKPRSKHGGYRITEQATRSVQPVWKLGGGVIVGRQTLLGWPYLAAFLKTLTAGTSPNVEVWPFKNGFVAPSADVVLVEIFPTAIVKRWSALVNIAGLSSSPPSVSVTLPGTHVRTISVTCGTTVMSLVHRGTSTVINDAVQVVTCALVVWAAQQTGGLGCWFANPWSSPSPPPPFSPGRPSTVPLPSGMTSRDVADYEGWILGV